MITVTLTFDSDRKKFSEMIDSMDDQFDFIDSLFWELDYGTGKSFHNDICIQVTEDNMV